MNRKHILTALSLFALILFNSCEDLLDTEESFTFEQEFVVNTPEHEFSQQTLYDLAAEEDVIDEYGDKVKEVSIQQVRIWLTAHEGSEEQSFIDGTLLVADPTGGAPAEIASFGTHNLSALLNNPTVLDHNNAGATFLGNLAAEPPHRFRLHADASFSEGPLDFTLVVEFSAKMVANPLK